MGAIIKQKLNIYVYILTVIFCIILFTPITAHAAFQNGNQSLSWSVAGVSDSSLSVSIDSITYQYDFNSKSLKMSLNGLALNGWDNHGGGKYNAEEGDGWCTPLLRVGLIGKYVESSWKMNFYPTNVKFNNINIYKMGIKPPELHKSSDYQSKQAWQRIETAVRGAGYNYIDYLEQGTADYNTKTTTYYRKRYNIDSRTTTDLGSFTIGHYSPYISSYNYTGPLYSDIDPYQPGDKRNHSFEMTNVPIDADMKYLTIGIGKEQCYWGSSSSNTNNYYQTAYIVINLEPALNQIRHTHNSSGVEYGQYNGTYHYKYTFCTGHGSDRSQNRKSSTEGHSFGGWSGWTNISVEQQRKQRSCSKCGYVDYAYQPRPYTITYNANNGSISKTSDTIGYGSTLGTLPTGTRTAYTLKGFFTAASGGSQVSSGTTVTGNATYYAQWTPVTYQIQYVVDTNNTIKNAVSNSNRTSYTIETATFNLVNPSRTGYTFEGWYTDSGLTNKVTSVSVGSYGNKTFYAKWKPITYSIRYILYNGTVSGNPSSYNIETATFTLKNPTQSGMAFLGWSGINDADTIITAPTTSFTVSQGTVGNIVVSAKWKPTDTNHGRTEVDDPKFNRFKVQ